MRKIRAGVAALALGVVLAACGADDGNGDPVASAGAGGSTTTSAPAPPAAQPGPTVSSALPDIEVVDVSAGTTVALRSYLTSGRPALLWFWAPHCTFCRAEAPDVAAFAAKYEGRIDVLGVGAQDSLRQAEGFVADTGTGALDMVWDRTGRSWVDFDVTNQPTVLVVDGAGEVQKRWFRNFDEQEIVAAAGI